MDFLRLEEKFPRGKIEISPSFIVCKSHDLMIKGKNFYAIWNPEEGLWSTDQDTVINMVDDEVKAKVDKEKKDARERYSRNPKDAPDIYGRYMKYSETGIMDHWLRYTQKQMADNYHSLNQKLIFENTETKKTDYATFKLPYRLEEGDHSAWDELLSVLYSDTERHKIEWAIGSVVTGASKRIQKFFVFYGSAGTGKSTVLNIVQKMFDGYWRAFKACDLGSMSKDFAMEPFADNPLLAIEHDGDLSRIEDNTRLNSIISHERMMINEKFTHQYTIQLNTMLFIGTNKPVRITDSKSGLIRRLIDIRPTGQTVDSVRYDELMDKINFELGAIAYHCAQVYNDNPRYYQAYVPEIMFDETNDMYNFIEEYSDTFTTKGKDAVSLNTAWALYNSYVEDARVKYPMTKRAFKAELRNYFKDYYSSAKVNGCMEKSVYKNFNFAKFMCKEVSNKPQEPENVSKIKTWIEFGDYDSPFDEEFKDCPAQYAVYDKEKDQIRPRAKWENCKTTLKDIDTDELHYVKIPQKIITIDFDIKGEDGNKSFEKNLEAATKWPKTYAELSKSGSGIHLHYIYEGDVTKLSSTAGENVEIKVFLDDQNGALRRKLTKCNNVPIAKINSGLPMKGESKKVVNKDVVMTEIGIRKLITSVIKKEYPNIPSTISGCMLINKVLNEAYENNDISYDVSDLHQAVAFFASNSSHHSTTCRKIVSEMHFKSKDYEADDIGEAEELKGATAEPTEYTFYDIEIFQNLFLVCYLTLKVEEVDALVKKLEDIASKKYHGNLRKAFRDIIKDLEEYRSRCVRMINPTPEDMAFLSRQNLIGFNCRRYDNHLCYARMLGYSNMASYNQSQMIIGNFGDPFMANGWNFSYTDVFDFSAKKQSLKKFEIELGMYHMENEYDWNKPLPEEHWEEVGDYCCNDVLSTLGVFLYRNGDWTARKILSALSGLSVNSTTNSHTTRIIFGKDKNPGLVYTDFMTGKQYGPAEPFEMPIVTEEYYAEHKDDWKSVDLTKVPKNCFPGYFLVRFKDGSLHNMYRGVDLGFGGYVFALPGMYIGKAQTEDVASEHPHSIKELNLFGKYTKVFVDLMDARIRIKHKAFDKASKLFGGKLAPFLKDPSIAKALSGALKIAINSVYGLTSAKFANPFRDPRNINNIVALRGALFMKTVQDAVEAQGFKVFHIKTDSIKIFEPTDEIIKFVEDIGQNYGYTFEVEHTWDRVCLVNNAVFIGRHGADDPESPYEWDAVGAQFQAPYVFKSLFSHEAITFEDMCETKSVQTAIYMDFKEGKQINEELDLAYKLRGSSRAYEDISKYERSVTDKYKDISTEDLWAQVNDQHDYRFIGKVGLFCPVIEGVQGGELVRSATDRKGNPTFASVTGANWVDDSGNTVNRWKEASVIESLHLEDQIDRSYYRRLVDDAKASIEKFGSFDEFMAIDKSAVA